jgi:uncharacterized protein (DUF488 family)
MELFTIGFAGKSAEKFFSSLMKYSVKKVIDIRLNNVSQLAGFTKKDDLKYFLNVICAIEYQYLPQLAPTKDLLDSYRKKAVSWEKYEITYLSLLEERQVLKNLKTEDFDRACLLCSEAEPDHCHRRLAAEYLQRKWTGLKILHIS